MMAVADAAQSPAGEKRVETLRCICEELASVTRREGQRQPAGTMQVNGWQQHNTASVSARVSTGSGAQPVASKKGNRTYDKPARKRIANRYVQGTWTPKCLRRFKGPEATQSSVLLAG